MSDGAHLGLRAVDALKTILGPVEGEEPVEPLTQEEFAEFIVSAPDYFEHEGETTPASYDESCRVMAKYFLLIIQSHRQLEWNAETLYAKACEINPKFAKYFDGVTGFMVGWAANAARSVAQLPPQANPAIITVE